MKKGKIVKIIIATHKEYKMPEDEMYLPLHVGAEDKRDAEGNELNLGYMKDNTGDNISSLNASFCELTGLYWAWKNLDVDYIGLVHYRRYFGRKLGRDPWKYILSYSDIEPYLGRVKLFVPKKRRYYIETLYSHYKHTHYSNQLDETRKIIEEKYPKYLDSYDRVVKHRYGYMFNMMIMEKCLLDEYCIWLFDVLFELQNRINISKLNEFQGRLYGRVAEIIFNVWLDYQLKYEGLEKKEVKELPYMHMEKINWLKKGLSFFEAKFFGKKYEKSF